MTALLKYLENGLYAFGVVLLGLLTTNIVLDVGLRSLLNQPIQGTYEVVIYWYMVGISAIGILAAERANDHIQVTLILERLHPTARRYQELLIRLVSAGVLLALAWYGLNAAWAKTLTGEFTGSNHIIVWPTRYFLPLAFLTFALMLVTKAIRRFREPALDQVSQHDPLEGGARVEL